MGEIIQFEERRRQRKHGSDGFTTDIDYLGQKLLDVIAMSEEVISETERKLEAAHAQIGKVKDAGVAAQLIEQHWSLSTALRLLKQRLAYLQRQQESRFLQVSSV